MAKKGRVGHNKRNAIERSREYNQELKSKKFTGRVYSSVSELFKNK